MLNFAYTTLAHQSLVFVQEYAAVQFLTDDPSINIFFPLYYAMFIIQMCQVLTDKWQKEWLLSSKELTRQYRTNKTTVQFL